MRCFACNAVKSIAKGDRVGFRETCDACSADLHACRNCELHDPGAHNECREANAEWVRERERANHCEYFTPSGRGGGEAAAAATQAKSALDSLFRK